MTGRVGGRVALLSALVIIGAASRLTAQNYFGQNQVQYDGFHWRVLETAHFLIYYYPQERQPAEDAARMAERAYERLSRVLDHRFLEKKPIVLFASRTDFGQNNVTGDLGEATGGVTEPLRHRMLLNFTGDYRSFEQVLTHEMVHAFQFDIFGHGKAGNGWQTLAEVNPPLWFAEGMAEYLSLGPTSSLTTAWMRDAALNGKIPSIEQLTDHPDRFFPYRFGHSLWAFIGGRWGDEAIGQIMNAVPGVGIQRAFRREIGVSLDDIGEQWKEELQTTLLPAVGHLQRPRAFAQALLSPSRSGGEIFLAPALSPDGRLIAFLSNGSFTKGQVFIDLWLGDGETGQRLERVVKSTTNPDYEELRVLYSQSAFSPDGRQLAFTAQRAGRDVLYLFDVRSRKQIRRFDLPVDAVTGPTWSPDGSRLAFSGTTGGVTDLYIVDADATHLTRLTNDRFGDLQPQWSPDGRTIAFATDRGEGASFALLKFPKWRIGLLDVATGAISVIPGQAGLNLNPQWAPDGRSLAYVSDRAGTANIFLYDFERKQHFQLTDLVGAVSAITEYSPAITWARGADKLAFTYYADQQYTIWTISHPRTLAVAPVRDSAPGVASDGARDLGRVALNVVSPGPAKGISPRPAEPMDSAANDSSSDATARHVSIAALLDSASLGLPDTTAFRDTRYRARFQPDYVARPSIGYAPDNYGNSVFGGATLVMSDMLGDHRLALSGEVNGKVDESLLFLGYTSLANRWQWSAGVSQVPYYFLSADTVAQTGGNAGIESQQITTYIARQVFGVAAYPLNRFARFEFGAGFNNIDRERWFLSRPTSEGGAAQSFSRDSTRRDPSLDYFDAQLAYVYDNTLFGNTGPIDGRRYRIQVSPVSGSLNWMEYLADYRRYDPIIFDYLTVATRLYASLSMGHDEAAFPKYIARPDFVRGYDRNNSFYLTCPIVGANTTNCSAVELLGSRVAVGNAELRFPLLRQFELGVLPISMPPVDGLFFYDEGLAWYGGQAVYGSRPANYNDASQRYPLRSYGVGLRINLFGYAVLRWDYAVPLDQVGQKGFWTWSLWPSF